MPCHRAPKVQPPPRTAEDGLRVTVTSAKAKFTEGEPMVFTVTLKNTSAKTFHLFDPTHFWNWRTRFGHWQVQPLFNAIRKEESTTLGAGKEIAVEVKLDATNKHQYQWTGPQLAAVMPILSLRPGKYPLVFEMNFKQHPQANRLEFADPFWVGELRTKPLEIEIVAEESAGRRRRWCVSAAAENRGRQGCPDITALWYENVGKKIATCRSYRAETSAL